MGVRSPQHSTSFRLSGLASDLFQPRAYWRVARARFRVLEYGDVTRKLPKQRASVTLYLAMTQQPRGAPNLEGEGYDDAASPPRRRRRRRRPRTASGRPPPRPRPVPPQGGPEPPRGGTRGHARQVVRGPRRPDQDPVPGDVRHLPPPRRAPGGPVDRREGGTVGAVEGQHRHDDTGLPVQRDTVHGLRLLQGPLPGGEGEAEEGRHEQRRGGPAADRRGVHRQEVHGPAADGLVEDARQEGGSDAGGEPGLGHGRGDSVGPVHVPPRPGEGAARGAEEEEEARGGDDSGGGGDYSCGGGVEARREARHGQVSVRRVPRPGHSVRPPLRIPPPRPRGHIPGHNPHRPGHTPLLRHGIRDQRAGQAADHTRDGARSHDGRATPVRRAQRPPGADARVPPRGHEEEDADDRDRADVRGGERG
ncbi:hypothetical protein THAOC_27470, partial [Thalassiosira oceanica]